MLKSNTILNAIAVLIKLILLLAIGESLYFQNYLTLFLSVLTILLTFLPAMLAKNYRLSIPLEFEFAIILFLFGSIFLGEIQSYYERFWWWDLILHTSAGIILGIIGFLIVYLLNQEAKINLYLSPAFVSLFSFCFALAIGVIWEIFEFFMDTVFGFQMQKGLIDTMGDFVVDGVGALLVSIVGYFYAKKVEVPFVDRWVERFVAANKKRSKKRQSKS